MPGRATAALTGAVHRGWRGDRTMPRTSVSAAEVEFYQHNGYISTRLHCFCSIAHPRMCFCSAATTDFLRPVVLVPPPLRLRRSHPELLAECCGARALA